MTGLCVSTTAVVTDTCLVPRQRVIGVNTHGRTSLSLILVVEQLSH